jgi:hypothetical protein
MQAIQDGLITVSIPEKPPKDLVAPPATPATTHPELVGNKVHPTSGGHGEISTPETTILSMIGEAPDFEPLLATLYQPVADLVASTQGMVDGELEEWKKAMDDALWWENPDESMQMTVAKVRKMTPKGMKNKSWGSIQFDQNDAPAVIDVMRERMVTKRAMALEIDGREITENDLDEIETALHGVNVMDDYFAFVAQRSETVLRDMVEVTAIQLVRDAILKFGIDADKRKHDNKRAALKEAKERMNTAYPDLLKASETAAQSMLDEAIDSSVDQYMTGPRPLEPLQEYVRER